MEEGFKRLCFTHSLMNLNSVVSIRFLGQAELDFGLRHSLKWEVGCAPHHPRKIPERLDTSLSHNSLSLSSWLLTFTSCTLWTTAIMPSCLYKPAYGGGTKVLPISHSFLKHLFKLRQRHEGTKSCHTTLTFSSVLRLSFISSERSDPSSLSLWMWVKLVSN